MCRPRRKRGVVAAGLRLGAWVVALALTACARQEAPPEPVRAVRTQRVTAGDLTGGVEWAGELRARREALLGFRVGGKLMTREVELGQAVRAGQVLARLDPNDLALSQQVAQAALQAATVQWTQAQADFQRYQSLHEQGFISAAELERRKTALDAARAQRDQAQAGFALQGNQASHTTLRADADGVVTAVLADPGTVVAAGSPVLRVAALGPVDAVFSVPESQVQALRALLQRAGALQVRVGASGAWLPATLRELASAADPATRTFLAKAALAPARAPSDSTPALGQTAAVRLPSAAAEAGVLSVPAAAVGERNGQAVVWTLDGATMTVKPVPVEVVQADAAGWRIKGTGLGQPRDGALGANAGEAGLTLELVTAGLHVLQPGQKVRRYGAAAVSSTTPSASAP